jgi:uncharacterized protein YhbP (UPF0306 family)
MLSVKQQREKQHKIERAQHAILARNQLLSLATTNNDGTPHINTAFFAYRDRDLFFLSNIRARHCKNIRKRSWVAVTIFDSHQKWNDDKAGVQIFGHAERCDVALNEIARKEYASRYRAYGSYIKSLKGPPDPSFRFFVIHTDKYVLLDEKSFGEEVYVKSPDI